MPPRYSSIGSILGAAGARRTRRARRSFEEAARRRREREQRRLQAARRAARSHRQAQIRERGTTAQKQQLRFRRLSQRRRVLQGRIRRESQPLFGADFLRPERPQRRIAKAQRELREVETQRRKVGARIEARRERRAKSRQEGTFGRVLTAATFLVPGPGGAAVKGGVTALRAIRAARAARGVAPAARAAPRAARGTPQATRQAAERQAARTRARREQVRVTRREASAAQEARVRAFGRAVARRTRRPTQVAAGTGAGVGVLEAAPVVGLTREEDVQIAGVSPGPALARLASGAPDIVAALARQGVAPGEDERSLLSQLGAVATGFVPGTIRAITHPAQTVEELADVYEQTYGPLIRGDREEFQRQLREGGALGPAIDVGLLAGPAASAAAGVAARRGVLGGRLQEITTAERPALRFAPGPGGAKLQDASGRLGKRLIQHRRDVRRQERQEQRFGQLERGEIRDVSPLEAISPAQLQAAGEVIPRGGFGVAGKTIPVPGLIAARQRLTRATAARAKGRASVDLQEQRTEVLKSVHRSLKPLSKEQKNLFVPAFLNLVRTTNKADALKDIDARIKSIVTERGKRVAREDEVKIPGRRQQNDNLKFYRELRKQVEEQGDALFTPELKAALSDIKEIDRSLVRGLEDIGELGPAGGRFTQAELRRQKPEVEQRMREGSLPDFVQALGGDVEGLRAALKNLPDESPRRAQLAQRLADAEAVEGLKGLRGDLAKVVVRQRQAKGKAKAELASERKSLTTAVRKEEQRLFESPEFGRYINRVGPQIERLRRQRGDEGQPGFVPSERRFTLRPGQAAAGGGQGLASFRRFRGELFRTGTEDLRLGVLTQGLERSIKQASSRKLIGTVAEDLAMPLTTLIAERTANRVLRSLPGQEAAQYAKMGPLAQVQALLKAKHLKSRDVPESLERILKEQNDAARGRIQKPNLEARTAREVLDDMDALGISQDNYVLWNPKKIIEFIERDSAAGLEALDQLTDSVQRAFAEGSQAPGALRAAIEESALRRDIRLSIEKGGLPLREEKGWVAIPKEAMDQLFSPPGQLEKFARIFDINKQQFSRLLLGYGNISWLAFQVGANAFLSGITGTGPLSMVRAQLWWNGLPKADRDALIPILNQQRNLLDISAKRSLGSTAGPLARQLRAMRETPTYQAIRRKSPAALADFFFGVDKAQTAFFRRAVFYNSVRREARKRMMEDVKGAGLIQDRLLGPLMDSRDLQSRMLGLIRNRRQVERHAEHVDRMLGDYLTFTARERGTLQRSVMFYGFMRHSLQLALWTMPTRHPVTLGVLGKLAQLSDAERREMFGLEDVPFHMAGIDIKLPAVGEIQINVARMSPLGNALFEAETPSALIGILPPAISIPLGQLTGIKLFRGTAFKIRGKSATGTGLDALLKGQAFAGTLRPIDHIRLFANQMEGLIPPARYLREAIYRGRQGDDTVLTFGLIGEGERPTDIPKSEPARSRVLQQERREEREGFGSEFLRQVTGLRRQPTPGLLRFLRELEQRREGGGGSRGFGSTSSGGYQSAFGGGGGGGGYTSAFK